MGRDSFGWPMPLPALVPDELSGPPKPRLRETLAPIFDLHHRLTRSLAKHNQEFDGPAPVTEVSVYLKIHVQRVGLNLCKGGFSAACRARVSWLERHVLCLRPTLGGGGLRALKKGLD